MISTQVPQPEDGDELTLLTGWLQFHRSALARKCDGLTDQQLVTASAPPSPLSLLGLVRHLTEMERVYAGWPLTGDGPKTFVYCTDEDEDADIIGLRADLAPDSMRLWHDECAASDDLYAGRAADEGTWNNRSVRWNLIKLVQEYARHNGHADLIRERLDGTVGE
jgi:Protein of unknown function (DUF664)